MPLGRILPTLFHLKVMYLLSIGGHETILDEENNSGSMSFWVLEKAVIP